MGDAIGLRIVFLCSHKQTTINQTFMKRFAFFLLMIGMMLPVFGQKLRPQTKRYLDSTFLVIKQSNLSPSFKAAAKGLRKGVGQSAGVFNDTLLYYTLKMETLAMKGKARGVWDNDLVRKARKQSPGNSPKAIVGRLNLYASMKD